MEGRKLITILLLLFIIYSVAVDRYQQSRSSSPVAASNSSALEDKLPEIKIEINHDQSLLSKGGGKLLTEFANSAQGKAVLKQLANANCMSDYLKPLQPKEFKAITMLENTPGNSSVPIECGQRVKVSYAALASDGKTIATEASKQWQIGAEPAMKTIDYMVMGAVQGGKLKASSSLEININTLFYNPKINPDGVAIITTQILEVSSLPFSNGKLQVFDTARGTEAVACGSTINVDYTISNLDGVVIYDGKNLPVKLGGENTPYGWTKALLHKGRNADITAIMPPEFTRVNTMSQPVANFYPADLKLPANQMTIFTFHIK